MNSICIYNPLNLKEIIFLSKKKINFSFFNKSNFNLINVARLNEQKDQIFLLNAINKIKKLKLKIICSRDKSKISKHILKKVDHENDWKKVFTNNIDLIILAVPPKLQEKILLFNMKHKKKII